jgi:hypothetical protein
MNEYFNNEVSDKLKTILKSKISDYLSIIEFSYVKIYISYIKSDSSQIQESFDYTNLEGCLCLVINRKLSCLFLQLYDYIHYNKQLELELYSNIDKGYSILNDNFHCIEFPSFFIGINFSSKISAEKMKNTIFYTSIISNLDNSLYHLRNSAESSSKKDDKTLIEKISNLLQGKLENVTNIVNCGISRQDNTLIYNVNKEEFEKNIESQGIHLGDLNMHFEKKIRNIFSKNTEVIGSSNNKETNENFAEYSKGKKKSIYSSLMKKVNSNYKQDGRRSSIKNVINFQVF